MRFTAFLAAVFMCTVFTVFTSQSVSAEADKKIIEIDQTLASSTKDVLQQTVKKEENQPKAMEPAMPVVHIVADGETLDSIALNYQTTWQRLFNKNATISDPNILRVGDNVTIPHESEVIPERPLPTYAPPVQSETSEEKTVSPTKKVQPSKKINSTRGSHAGNTYTPGYCTWYAKQRRPDLPNNLGNASTWVSRAQAQGIPTGSVPRVGAIGQQGNHVVYVERVNGDGTITVTDMNFAGRGVITTRTVPASSHVYIY